MKLTEAIIQKDLYFSIGYQRLIAVPNIMPWRGNGECDLLIVTKAMYTDEYEIKLDRSDFLADRKKKKWRYIEIIPKKSPNRFWYVCPAGIIKVEDLLPGQGLIYIDENAEYTSQRVKIIKKAVNRHKHKISEEGFKKLMEKMHSKYWWLLHKHLEGRRLASQTDVYLPDPQ